MRVFGDRLVDENDTNWLYNMLRECVRTHFRENFDGLLEHLGRTDGRVRFLIMQFTKVLLFHDLLGDVSQFRKFNVWRLHCTRLTSRR